jgi:predicted transcriptional regulator
MLEKLDLESAIYRVLSNEQGHSQNELLEELLDYSKRLKNSDIILRVEKGNLSRKLKSLEMDGIVHHGQKKMDNRDQFAYSYFIRKELTMFEYIINHMSKDFIDALDVSLFNIKDWKKAQTLNDDKPIELTRQTRCSLIHAFMRSAYVRNLIKSCGFNSIYEIYRKDVYDYCDLGPLIDIVKDLIKDGIINNLEELGTEFRNDAETRKAVIETMFSHRR